MCTQSRCCLRERFKIDESLREYTPTIPGPFESLSMDTSCRCERGGTPTPVNAQFPSIMVIWEGIGWPNLDTTFLIFWLSEPFLAHNSPVFSLLRAAGRPLKPLVLPKRAGFLTDFTDADHAEYCGQWQASSPTVRTQYREPRHALKRESPDP